MNFVFKTLSLVGPRGENQDCILEPTSSGVDWWCGIADGVGGSRYGAAASRLCIDALKQSIADGKTMDDLFSRISEHLIHKAKIPGFDRDMSSTLSVLRLSRFQAFVGHVGDTRITHYRNGGAIARTHAHTEVQQLLDDGVISKFQARRYPRRNVILSAMTPGKGYNLFKNRFSIRRADRILLTSDGFHQKLWKKGITQFSAGNSVFDSFFRSIEYEVSNVELTDDATCLAIEIT